MVPPSCICAFMVLLVHFDGCTQGLHALLEHFCYSGSIRMFAMSAEVTPATVSPSIIILFIVGLFAAAIGNKAASGNKATS
jgi:hypothetical protein